MPTLKKEKERPFKCARCDKTFTSMNMLRKHSKNHLDHLQELKLLEQGHVPAESKFGENFKGKNRIIVA